ncbi:hypothetical protein HJG60_011859 [Phyllostomus discolor]|uniref:Secreted protein n=1 Tax=Phyllostomus discolor TaxID=89673 RepID=A0A834DW03_9CHIR|nr:hypothetical protein HJG60_011859 [Phyllostomus discolor]
MSFLGGSSAFSFCFEIFLCLWLPAFLPFSVQVCSCHVPGSRSIVHEKFQESFFFQIWKTFGHHLNKSCLLVSVQFSPSGTHIRRLMHLLPPRSLSDPSSQTSLHFVSLRCSPGGFLGPICRVPLGYFQSALQLIH